MRSAQKLLHTFRDTHSRLHRNYENLFWISYMGDRSVDEEKNAALAARDAFFGDPENLDKIAAVIDQADETETRSLLYWKSFFGLFQAPERSQKLKSKIARLETKMQRKFAGAKEGYLDPKTKKFVGASKLKMRQMMMTEDDEALRRACFEALEKLAYLNLDNYVQYVQLLNEYAVSLGYEDFYAYKLRVQEGMSKRELFDIFDEIYETTKYALANIRAQAKKQPGLRKPWNYYYFTAGDFAKEEDQYFPFALALERWGRSFQNLGVDFKGGTLELDLVERPGKYNNGFCHWPELVHYQNDQIVPGRAHFTCNVVYGQVGSGAVGYKTLFHEGGHAAHLLNSTERDTCLNHEYPPLSASWAETQSMFMDTILGSYAWLCRYAKNEAGTAYPLTLYRRKLEKLEGDRPLSLNPMMCIAVFERWVYEDKNLTKEKVLSYAKKAYRKYYDRSEDSLLALTVPHIYSWESACYYHSYALAKLAVMQWREYFYKKYGRIVDNPAIAPEMERLWKRAAAMSFAEFVREATGRKLTAKAWVKEMTKGTAQLVREAEKEAGQLKDVKISNKPINLNARIRLVSEKKKIADNKISFAHMAEKYARWLREQN